MKRPVPSAMTMDVTEGCNLACDYCFTHSLHKPRKMGWDMAKRIIDWWIPQTDPKEYRQIGFWGGEPLLEWDLIQKVVRYTEVLPGVDRNMEFGGTSNGVLYTEEKVEWGLKHNCLFLISLDGIEEVHDGRRKTPGGKGSWKTVDKNVRKALELFPQQRVRATISADTIGRFFETVQYFVDDLKIQHFAFSPVYEDVWDEEHLETLAEQFELINDLVVKRRKSGQRVEMKHLDDVAKESYKGEPMNPCGAANKYSCWSVDGYLYPCHRFNKHGQTTEQRAKSPLIIGRPKGDSFEYIHDEWRQKFIDFSKGMKDRCGGCEIGNLNHCNGGCYATNFDMTGSIEISPQSQCDYQKVLLEAGKSYRKKLDAAGILLGQEKARTKSCTCFNMCYEEGTNMEMFSSDAQTDIMCICYNTNYGGSPNPQTRSMKQIREQKNAQQRIVDAAIKVMGDYNNGEDNEGGNRSDEQLCGTGDRKQGDGVQYAGTDKRSACGACKGNCGEAEEEIKEDPSAE